jgi:hypothetical protein
MKHQGPLSATYRRIRADGWTPERRVTFCVNLAGSRSVTFAAASVGLSRKSAYALRKRDRDFAALWDSALAALKAPRPACSAKTALRQTEGDEAEARRMVNHASFNGNRSPFARRIAESERDLFFAALGKTSTRRIVARPNRSSLLPTSENSPTLDVSKSA